MQRIAKIIIQIRDNLFKTYKIMMLITLIIVILAIVNWCSVIIRANNKNEDNLQKSLIKNNTILYFKENNKINTNHIDHLNIYNIIVSNNQSLSDKEVIYSKIIDILNKYISSNNNNLNKILTQYMLNNNEIMSFFNQHQILRNLISEQTLNWKLDKNKELQFLTWLNLQQETLIYICKNNSNVFSEEKLIRHVILPDKIIQGKIIGNFTSSAVKAGLIYNEAYEVSKALGWQIDLHKLKYGDKFSILLSSEILNGHSEQNRLLGVHLLTNGKNYYAFRAKNGRYYDSEANSLERSFLRYPTSKVFSVSSPFSLCRINPVTGLPAPHQGVDFSMPIGTPILAVSDGEVIVAKYSEAAGNFIAIRHSNQYITRYMHLRKLLVKPGQKVKKGERIALSGNTGRTTGPHLHYELWFNQQTINPLTASLPNSRSLTGKDRQLFLASVKENKLKLTTN